MRKTLLLILALALHVALPAQWYYSSLEASTNAVEFVSSNKGFASTGFTLAKTTDGGTTWAFSAGTAMDSIFLALDFPSETTGYAVGLSGNMRKTTDGGNTWSRVWCGTSQNLRAVCFTDENNGYVAGDGHTLMRTADGGATWQTLTSPVESCWSMQFLSPTFGILAGNTRSVYRTQDGGVNWLEIAFDTPNKFSSVHFPDGQTGYACGSKDPLTPCMIKSTDGGLKWTEVPVTTGKGLWTVRFIDSHLGYAAGMGGTIIKTTDGGSNWTLQSTPDLGLITALWFVDANHGWAGGASLIRTDNGGGAAGIFDLQVRETLSIGPNPAGDRITVCPTDDLREGTLTILNNQGRVVWEERVDRFPVDVMLPQLTPGLYIVRIASGTDRVSGRFIKR